MTTSPAPIVLRGITVVDPRDGSLSGPMDVAISEGRIASVSAASSEGDGIDATGTFVVPGFLDMHAHALNAKDPAGALQLMLAYGITGFRQMDGGEGLVARRKAGTLPLGADTPRLLELPSDVLSPANAGSIDQALKTLRAQVAAGADFIKVAIVGVQVFTALQAEAKTAGTTISGHLPAAMDPVVAARQGIRSIEHLGPGISILAACSTDEAGIRFTLAQEPGVTLPNMKLPFVAKLMNVMLMRIVVNPVQRSSAASITLLQHAIDTFDESKARALAKTFADSATWHTPTLVRQLTTEECDLPRFPVDPDLKYVAPKTLKLWRGTAANFIKKFSATERATLHAEYDLQLRLLKIFDEAGVGLLAGTDATGGVWLIPGPSLHHEFDELARAGLTPLRVLQSTTISAAEFLGATATHGTVEPGKVADLVILNANPVESVEALHAVAGVVLGGTYLSADDLEELKSQVSAARSIT